MNKTDSLERSPSLPVVKTDEKERKYSEERRNTLPANSRDQVFDVKSATISHQIPHQLRKNTLITPTPCGYCHKFIWGLLKEAYTCFECEQHWHPNCRIYIQDDCGLTLRMLSSLVLLNDKGGTVKARSSVPSIEKKEIKADKEVIEKETKEHHHQKSPSKTKNFEEHNLQPFNLKVPTWCKVCKSFIWSGNHAFRCQKCQLECHAKCVPNIEVDCLTIAGGQLSYSDSKLDDQSTNIIRERRTNSHKSKQATFKKNKGRFTLNFSKPKKNGVSSFHQSSFTKSTDEEKHENEIPKQDSPEVSSDSDELSEENSEEEKKKENKEKEAKKEREREREKEKLEKEREKEKEKLEKEKEKEKQKRKRKRKA